MCQNIGDMTIVKSDMLSEIKAKPSGIVPDVAHLTQDVQNIKRI